MTTCKNCGSEIADTAKFCLRCGGKVEKLKEDNTLCPSCNKEFPRGYKFCPFCGVRFNNKAKSEEKEECINRPAETSMKSNTVAVVEQEHVSKEVSAFVTADSTFSGQAQSSSTEPISAEYIEEKTSCPSCKAMLPAKDKKFCPNCGVNIEEARKTLEPAKCLLCGAELAPNIKFCPVCGAELKPNTKFCPARGTVLVRQSQMQGVQSASKNQAQFSYGQNFSSSTNILPKKEKPFNLCQKFFMLLVVVGYFLPEDNLRRMIYCGGSVFYHIYKAITSINLLPGLLLFTLSTICAGLTLISAIAYQIGKNPAMKSFSRSTHFLGFFLFSVWMIFYILYSTRASQHIHIGRLLYSFYYSGINITLAGCLISSISIEKKRPFNLYQKFFTLAVVLGYFLPIIPIDKTGVVNNSNLTSFTGLKLQGELARILFGGDNYHLFSLSIICAGLTLISAIAYKISKNSAMKTLSTLTHFGGFLAFAMWVILTILINLLYYAYARRTMIIGFLSDPGIYVILAGWIISSIPIRGKNDNV